MSSRTPIRRRLRSFAIAGAAVALTAIGVAAVQSSAGAATNPFQRGPDFSNDTVPTLIVAAQNDSIAPPAQHAKVFHNSLPATQPKMYLELAGASHFTTNSPNTTVAQYAISWLKRFIDNDTRYTQFLCPTPSTSSTISAISNTCPF